MEGNFQLVLVKSFGESLNVAIAILIKVVTAEVNLRIDSVLHSEVGPVKKHGVGDIDLDDRHGCCPQSQAFYNTLKHKRQSDDWTHGWVSALLFGVVSRLGGNTGSGISNKVFDLLFQR
jgi:hypothetical protein